MTKPIITTDDIDDVKLTKREEAHIKELEHFADGLQQANLLYGSALDGMQSGLKASSDRLAAVDMDAAMDAVQEEVGAKAVDVLRADIDDIIATEDELNADDAQEDAILAEEAAGPPHTTG